MRSATAFSIACAAVLLGCNPPAIDNELVPVKISLSAPETRAVDFGTDGSIQRATVYVLEPSASDNSIPGNVVDVFTYSSGGQTEYELVTSLGPKYFFMVLNGPSAGNPADYSALKALTFSMEATDGNSLSRPGGPLMTGLSERTDITTAMQSIPISVTRQVFRANIASITNSLPQHCNLTILYAYLSNYVKNYSLGNGNAPAILYGNSRGRNGGVINGTSVFSDNGYTAVARSMTVGSGASGTDLGGIGMYAFPNPCTADTWSTGSSAPRKTRLVLVASVSGAICYYPIALNPQSPNCAYDLDIEICNVGTADPEAELPKGTLQMNISVQDWSTTIKNSNL